MKARIKMVGAGILPIDREGYSGWAELALAVLTQSAKDACNKTYQFDVDVFVESEWCFTYCTAVDIEPEFYQRMIRNLRDGKKARSSFGGRKPGGIRGNRRIKQLPTLPPDTSLLSLLIASKG